jgi:maltooligosyltrehalose trehalohydrolase
MQQLTASERLDQDGAVSSLAPPLPQPGGNPVDERAFSSASSGPASGSGPASPWQRRYPAGADCLREGAGVHFRVWAPRCSRVDVLITAGPGVRANGEPSLYSLEAEPEGYFSGSVKPAGVGTRYKYRLDGGDAFPDPASRFQPEGPHGPSEVINPATFSWSDQSWRGVRIEGQVIYEMHIGTFTPEGTWAAAERHLPELAELGVTVLEVMPVSEFSGEFGWGYDGVQPYAPSHLYGTPDDFRHFVDRAHAHKLAVILDVVYNHLGPDGNYLGHYSDHYFTERYKTDWGPAINFDDRNSHPVRQFFCSNASYWIDEFHLDGLRLDATQNIYDAAKGNHILTELVRGARAAAEPRSIIIVAENEPQQVRMLHGTEHDGHGMDGMWNDDLHHTVRVALTQRHDAYFTDYRGTPQEFISAIKYGFLYQGQWYRWQEQCRGSSAFGIKPASFITFLQNHDQIANSARGERLHQFSSPGRYRALTALILLSPGTPMLLMGQEFAASSPFQYFADLPENLVPLVRKGRAEFLAQWRNLDTQEMRDVLPDPCSRETFLRSKLDHSERERHAEAYHLHRDLLRLRREDAVFQEQRPMGVDGAVLSPQCFVLRYFAGPENRVGGDRLLIVNLGADLDLSPIPEPLLGPMPGCDWEILWSSENPRYGGYGVAPLTTPEDGVWRIPGESATVLHPQERKKTHE